MLSRFELGGAGFLGDAMLEGGARLDGSRMAKGAEEVIEECLALALFVALQRAGEGDEFFEGGDQFCRGHPGRNEGNRAAGQGGYSSTG